MDSVDLNLVAILVAAVAHFLLGGLWYSPLLFAKPFVRAMGLSAEEQQAGANPMMYVWAFLGGLVKSAVLAMLIGWVGAEGVGEAALLGVVVSLGIHGAATAVTAVFEDRHPSLVAIGVGYDTVALALAGAIIAAMS